VAEAPKVEVVGLVALQRDLQRGIAPGGSITAAMGRAGVRAINQVAERARAAMPRDSGDMAGSVEVQTIPSGAGVLVGVPYWGWVDFGGPRPDGAERSYQEAGRYLFPAAETLDVAAQNAYGTEIASALDRFAWTNTSEGSVHD
jgi:hypothetical protein